MNNPQEVVPERRKDRRVKSRYFTPVESSRDSWRGQDPVKPVTKTDYWATSLKDRSWTKNQCHGRCPRCISFDRQKRCDICTEGCRLTTGYFLNRHWSRRSREYYIIQQNPRLGSISLDHSCVLLVFGLVSWSLTHRVNVNKLVTKTKVPSCRVFTWKLSRGEKVDWECQVRGMSPVSLEHF